MPPREIDVRISQGCGIHTDLGGKMDPRVKPEDDYKKTTCITYETASVQVLSWPQKMIGNIDFPCQGSTW